MPEYLHSPKDLGDTAIYHIDPRSAPNIYFVLANIFYIVLMRGLYHYAITLPLKIFVAVGYSLKE